MRKIILSILLVNFVGFSFALDRNNCFNGFQTDTTQNDTLKIRYWKFGGIATITVSQVSLTNWAAGGENSLSGNGNLKLFANFNKENISFENNFEVAYGIVRQGTQNTRKSVDKIDFTSKGGLKASETWNYTAQLNFKTQMFPGYNYPNDSVKISDLFAPAYILTSIGMEYNPDEELTLLISPLTGKITTVFDEELADKGAFGVKEAVYDNNGNIITHGDRARYEFGGYLKMIYKTTLMENVTLESKLDVFSNYVHKPLNLDIGWELVVNMMVNRYISANIISHMIYDDNSATKVQFKEVLGIGFTYKFD